LLLSPACGGPRIDCEEKRVTHGNEIAPSPKNWKQEVPFAMIATSDKQFWVRLRNLPRAVLYKAKSQIPRLNPHYFLRRISGLIHVGANAGQERDLYAKFNLNVLWVEANPEAFEKLQYNIKTYPSQIAVNSLITERDDVDHIFHIANNDGESSSIFELHDHKIIWPNVKFERDIRLKSITLDSLINKLKKPITEYQALVIDTQGAELLVLKGATKLLRSLQYIRVEAPDFESYAGCAKIGELVEFLKKFEFWLIRKDKFPQPVDDCGQYYELLFRKADR
jgi:methyltransferase, FkbM family